MMHSLTGPQVGLVTPVHTQSFCPESASATTTSGLQRVGFPGPATTVTEASTSPSVLGIQVVMFLISALTEEGC